MLNRDRQWRDGIHLKIALSCLKSAEPARWREVLLALRGSSRYRKQFLKEARGMATFRMFCALCGAGP